MATAQVDPHFEAHRGAVFGWAYRVVRNHHDAMDVTQEVFVKWWRARNSAAMPENPTAWLRRVTINDSLNLCRRRKRTRTSGDATVPERIAEKQSVGAEEAETLTRALDAMTELQRGVLIAKVYDDHTFSEIARQMQLAIPTVKTHYLRALKAARGVFRVAGLLSGERS